MDGWFNISRQKEEEEAMVSALHRVISRACGGTDDDDNLDSQPPPTHGGHHQHHHPMPAAVWEGAPEAPPVFSTGESSSNNTPSKKKKKKMKSGKEYRGVRRRGNRWVAEIWDPHQGKVRWLSSYSTAEEAARAYDRKAIEYRGVDGAFPYMNFPLEDYHLNYVGTDDNNADDQTATSQIVVGPGLSSSTSAGTNDSAPSYSSTATTGVTELPNNVNDITAAEEDDPLLLLKDFDDDTLLQFMALANSLSL